MATFKESFGRGLVLLLLLGGLVISSSQVYASIYIPVVPIEYCGQHNFTCAMNIPPCGDTHCEPSFNLNCFCDRNWRNANLCKCTEDLLGYSPTP